MELYGKILLWAMPAFLALVLLEKWWGMRIGFDTVRHNDMLASLSSGITNVTKDVLGWSIVLVSYAWLVERFALVHWHHWSVYLVAIIVLDFAGYWTHRLQHEVNLFWNVHIIHHSSEEFNLACALRQSISNIIKIYALFLIPAALLGVPAQLLAIVAPLHLFAQFWYHTRHIHKMGFLEKIIVTPSHHRVHHAINPEYLDKNYSQIFIVWDKWFGTFQEELPNVPPVYGVTRPVQTWNPIKINFIHLYYLLRDAWYTRSWLDKLKLWLMPLGWRPADVKEKLPIQKIDHVFALQKYDKGNQPALIRWSWFQLVMVLLFISYLFKNLASIGIPGIYAYGIFIFLSIYSLTDLLDGNKSSVWVEAIKNLYGFILFVYLSFSVASSVFILLPYLLTLYFVGATLVVGLFVHSLSLISSTEHKD